MNLADQIIDFIGGFIGGFIISFIIYKAIYFAFSYMIFIKKHLAFITFVLSSLGILVLSSLMPIGINRGTTTYLPPMFLIFLIDLWLSNYEKCSKCNKRIKLNSDSCKYCMHTKEVTPTV